MGFQLNTSVLNQKGSPAIYTDTFANRPPFGYAGRLFISNDTAAIYEDTGTAWVLIANVSSGAGTLQQVTTNGNTSNVGISVTAGGVSSNSLTVTTLTPGSVPFVGTAGLITQDNTNLFFDDTNNRLGINTNTPSNNLDVHGTGTTALLALNNTSSNQSLISFLKNSTAKWRIGNSSTDFFEILNVALTTNAIRISSANNSAVFISSVQADDFLLQPTGYSLLASLSRNLTGAGYGVLTLRNSANGTIQPSALTIDRTYTLPDATGTFALTSNLASYLPLSGGTLTGNLGGTTASFSSDITLQYSKSIIWNTASNQYIGADTNNLALGTAGVNRILINLSGEVAVGGTPEGTVKFKVTGDTSDNTAFTYFARNLAGTSLFNIRNDGLINTGTLALSPYNNSISGRSAIIESTGALGYLVSTRESKENIKLINDISYIFNLKPVQFNYRKKDSLTNEYTEELYENINYGFIADEVEQINENLVFYNTLEDGTKKLAGVEYNNLIALLTKTIQVQQTQIESLITRIELLENK